MENVVDVIVVERVLSYRVQSCILLRTCCKQLSFYESSLDQREDNNGMHKDNQTMNFGKGDEKRNDCISIVDLFSSELVELTYSECIKIWKEINDVLQHNQSQLATNE